MLRTARQFSHACAEKADEELPRSYHLLLVCPRDTPNIRCKFSHTSPDLLIRSGQVKKYCFSSGERASGRMKSVVNSVDSKERHGAYCFSSFKLRKLFEGCALWIKCNRIVFFERVPRNLFESDFNLKRYSFEKYTVLIALILGFYYICGQFLLHLWSIIAFVTSTVPLSFAFY